jgi:hypothetical protein
MDPECMKITDPLTICVAANGRGASNVAIPHVPRRINCETLADARSVAHRSAAHRRLCELVVHDAYCRAIQREIVHDRSPSAV